MAMLEGEDIMNYRYFSEYREKDYHVPRSIREAYGWDAPLWVDEDPPLITDITVVAVLAAAAGWMIWFAYGWL